MLNFSDKSKNFIFVITGSKNFSSLEISKNLNIDILQLVRQHEADH